MATMSARLTADGVTIAADGFGELAIPRPSGARRRDVIVWDAALSAAASDETASAFLSDLIGEEAHLVFMDEPALRHKASLWTPDKVAMSFADAFPVLVATTASLAVLNRDIEKHGGDAVPMARFRPNVVVDCDEAWAEDRWTRLYIGDVVLDLVKPSDRCLVTTTDQHSGRRMGKEPLAALARIHRSTDPRINGVIFGINAVPRALGEIDESTSPRTTRCSPEFRVRRASLSFRALVERNPEVTGRAGFPLIALVPGNSFAVAPTFGTKIAPLADADGSRKEIWGLQK